MTPEQNLYMRTDYVKLFDIAILHRTIITLHFPQKGSSMNHVTKILLVLLVGIVTILLFSNSQAATSQETTKMLATKIRIASNGGEAVIALYDNPMSKNFAAMLPLSVTFRDYAREEKIADIPHKLATAGGLSAKDIQGDFTYYAPWGNLAIFYKGYGKDERLYTLGHIESGKEWLAGQRNNFTARIEIVSSPLQHGNKRERNNEP